MQKKFESREFYSSAFLIASGVELLTTYKEGPRTVFVFEDNEQVQDLLKNYFGMQATVNAASFAGAIKNLKSVIHTSHSKPNSHYDNNKQSQKTSL